jgi:hypothetical protein
MPHPSVSTQSSTPTSIKSFQETVTSPNTQNKVPETDHTVISVGECLENLKQLLYRNSMILKKTEKHFNILNKET